MDNLEIQIMLDELEQKFYNGLSSKCCNDISCDDCTLNECPVNILENICKDINKEVSNE